MKGAGALQAVNRGDRMPGTSGRFRPARGRSHDARKAKATLGSRGAIRGSRLPRAACPTVEGESALAG